ncbi:hypothetical protein MMC30_007059 [Trapelia coarctata]|nr:hypothetical protein [Trapelia coarctata]
MVLQNYPTWTRFLDRIQHLVATIQSQPPEQDRQPRTQIGAAPRNLNDPTRRTVITENSIVIYAWPSRGGLIVLEEADAIDFTFLGLDRLDPPLRRSPDQALEDSLCQKLLLLGAKWWDSESRKRFIVQVSMGDSRAMRELDEERIPGPTPRERRWVRVGWPSEPRGGLWVAEFDENTYDIEDEDDLVPEDTGRLVLARDMDERCEILRRLGARFFGSLDEYEGRGFLRAWEGKMEGEVGPLQKTWFVE